MNPNASFSPSSPESVLAKVRGELSSHRRWAYRLIRAVAVVGVTAILSLWTTEPRPLPLRLHVAFGLLTGVGLGWTCVLTWVLSRRNCPTAFDQIATGWMAAVASGLSVAVFLPIAIVRGSPQAAILCAAVGLLWLSGAAWMLRAAYRQRSDLRAKLAELESRSRAGVVS